MPPVLNRDEPFGEVFGEPGVVYAQDYRYFDAAGQFVSEEPGRPKERKARTSVDKRVEEMIFGDEPA